MVRRTGTARRRRALRHSGPDCRLERTDVSLELEPLDAQVASLEELVVAVYCLVSPEGARYELPDLGHGGDSWRITRNNARENSRPPAARGDRVRG